MAIAAGVTVAIAIGFGPSPPKLPDPNGYDDIVRAGLLVKEDSPGKANWGDSKALSSYIAANRATLERVRLGLGRECRVPIAYDREWLAEHAEVVEPIRAVGRLLMGEAMVAEAEGRIVDASKILRDELAVGQAVTQGGLGIDLSVGTALQAQAIQVLRKLRDRLPREEISALLRELEALDRKREPVDAFETRWLAWYQGANNPILWSMLRVSGMEKTVRAAERGMVVQGRNQGDRTLRFFLVELAIHAYHEDKQTWPRSVRDLVPGYLTVVPIDPRNGLPIDLPTNPAGELTDDLSAIQRRASQKDLEP